MGFRIEVISPPSYSLRQSNARSCQIQDVQQADLPDQAQYDCRSQAENQTAMDRQSTHTDIDDLCQISRVHRPVKDHIVQPCSHDRHRHADNNKIQDPVSIQPMLRCTPHANYGRKSDPCSDQYPVPHDINMKNCKRYWIRYRHKTSLPPVI